MIPTQGQSDFPRSLLTNLGRSHLHMRAVHVLRGPLGGKETSPCARCIARYPHAMAGYIAWLWDQWDHFSAVPPDSWRELRTRAHCEGQHLRLPESLASLYLGLDLGLTYASELGALSQAAADQLHRDGWAALVETGARQHRQVEALRPSLYFLTILG